MPLPSVRDQLQAIKGALQYTYGDASRDATLTDWLADAISRQGIDNLQNIAAETRAFDVTLTRRRGENRLVDHGEWTETQVVWIPYKVTEKFDFTIYFNRLTLADLPIVPMPGGGTDNYVVPATAEHRASGVFDRDIPEGFTHYGTCSDPAGAKRTHFEIYIRFLGEGIPLFIFYPIVKESGGVFSGFFETIRPILPAVSIGLSVFAPGIGTAIGQAVLGSAAAAASPYLVSAIGNAALGTVLSGGNVKAAVASAIAGAAGSVAGTGVARAIDSQLAGQVAAAATSSALLGQDPREAAKIALLQSGAQTVIRKG